MVLDTNSTIHTSQQWVPNRTKQRTVAQSTITFLDLKTGGVGTSDGIFCSNISNFLKILENHNEWHSESARFFMRDHQIHGNGFEVWSSILSWT